MNKKRKLAAILFADIVGYTALMQKDEQNASILLRHFQQQLEEKVAAHKGQIVNFYGDGALCTFQIPIDAVRCGMALQTTFRDKPTVPVRIGIHSGTVTLEGDKIFGNSVNITARIESMGVAGGILLSKKVRDEVKNNPDLQLQSLGSFEFKNVEEPLEVFALANDGLVIPKRSEMKGKIKTTKKNKWLMPSIVGLLLLAAMSYWQWMPNNSMKLNEPEQLTANTPLPPNVLNERVAIIPIQNNTTDKELDILGKMAADWITRGLMEIEGAEVVSPYTVRHHLAAVGILPGNSVGKSSFSELTGARNFIDGSFYQEGDELIFNLKIVDAIKGNILYHFDQIRGNIQEKEILIAQLQEKISGYWVAKELVDKKKIKAPNYQAYQLYIELLQTIPNREQFKKLLALDSTFYLPRLRYLNMNQTGFNSENKLHFEFLERHHAQLSSYEKSWFDFVKNLFLGDVLKAFEAINELRKKYPNDIAVNLRAAILALDGLNNPELALKIFKDLGDDNQVDNNPEFMANVKPLYILVIALKLQNHQLFQQQYHQMTPAKNSLQLPFLLGRLWGASHLGLEEDFDRYLKEFYSNDKKEDFLQVWFSGNVFSNLYKERYAQKFRKALLEFVQQSNQQPILSATFKNFLEVIEGKKPEVDFEQLAALPENIQIINLHRAGVELAKRGEHQAVALILQKLKDFSKPNLNTNAATGAGRSNYIIGAIYTQLGDYEKALTYLKRARDLGLPDFTFLFEYDNDLAPLFDMSEFKALNAPIWPEVKD